MFDPEKVERWVIGMDGEQDMHSEGDYVLSSDYDQLLEMHKKVCLGLETLRYVIGE